MSSGPSAKKLSPFKASPIQKPPNKEEDLEETFRPLANLNDNRNVSIWVERILKANLQQSDLKILECLIKNNDELLFSTFKVFENERDEEEMVDTVLRIIQKYREYENLMLQESKKNDEDRKERDPSESIGKSTSTMNESYFKQKTITSSEKKEGNRDKSAEHYKTEYKEQQIPIENKEMSNKKQENPRKSQPEEPKIQKIEETIVKEEPKSETKKKSAHKQQEDLMPPKIEESKHKEETKAKEIEENGQNIQKISLATIFKVLIEIINSQKTNIFRKL